MHARSSAVGFAALILLSALAAGCSSSPTAPIHYAPFSQVDLVVGAGDDALNGKTLSVQYTGWLYDASKADKKGAVFSSTTGGAPFTFVLGIGQVIAGWDQGVPGMKVGGIRRLIIPPSLAYGSSRAGAIPPNATLIFEIELVTVT